MNFQVRCNPELRFLKPVRPIARMLCDILKVRKSSRACALFLAAVAAAVVLASYHLAKTIDQRIADGVKTMVQERLAREAATHAALGLANLLASNAQLIVVQFVILQILQAAYELGRTRCFALLALAACTLWGAVGIMFFFSDANVDDFLKTRSTLIAIAATVAAVLAWFWTRYIQRFQPNRRVFDDDVGAALIHFRSR